MAQLIYLPSSFFTSIILIRYLSPVDYGNYKIVLSLSGVMIYIVSLGIQHSISRFTPEFIELGDNHLIKRLVGTLALIRFFAVTALVILLNVFKSQFVGFFNLPAVFLNWLWMISAIYVLTHTGIVFGQYYHSAILDMKTITLHDSLKPLVFVLLIALVAVFDLGFPGVLITILICEAFSFVFYFVSYRLHTKEYHGGDSGDVLDKHDLDWQRITRYSLHSALYTFGGLAVGTYIDSFIIAKFLDVSRVAFYSFALMLVSIIHVLNPITLFKNVMSNILVRRYVASSDEGLFSFFFSFTSKLGLFVAVPSYFVFFVLVGTIISLLYRQDYLVSIPAIYVLAVLFLMRTISFGLSTVITTLELVRYFNFYYVIALYNVVASIMLVQSWGIVGVAAATCSAEVLWCLYLIYIVIKKAEINIKLPLRSSTMIVGNTVLVSLLVLLVRPVIDSVPLLILVIIIAGFAYLVLSSVTKPFTEAERGIINRIIGRPLWRF